MMIRTIHLHVPTLRRAALLLSILVPALASAAGAQGPGATPRAMPAVQSDSALRIVLLTMGPGDAVWERFGHNALWVHDPKTGTDKAYNYGMFDFRQENFLLNFIRGRMWYWTEGFDAYLTLDHYRSLNRSVWAQELNLTPGQAAQVRDFLAWNERPENRFYRYDYYRDNCSTRIRDVIDRITGGALRAATANAASGTTYRWHTRRLVAEGAPSVPMYTALETGLGAPADRPISKWEEMFLPMKLRDGLRQVRVRDAAGNLVPIVKREQTLFTATRPRENAAPPSWIPGYLLAGLAFAGVLGLLAVRAGRSRSARVGFSVLAIVWLGFAAAGGLILAGLWAFTDHAIAYRNENLLQLSPLALPLIVLLPMMAYGSRRRWVRGGRLLAFAIAALSVMGLVIQLLPGVDQVNGEIIALALPINLAMAWAAWYLAPAPQVPGAARPRGEQRPAVAA